MSTPEPARTVLIIEPDATTVELYRRELSRHFRILTCATASAGAALIASEPLSAVVLEPSGAEPSLEAVEAALGEALCTSDLPLIICSILDDRSVGHALGASLQLVKPVLPATLLTALTSLLTASADIKRDIRPRT
jgi:DNA-binding response OmpR family regulator